MGFLLYLLNSSGMDTGECFRSYAEVEQWFYGVMGRWPNTMEKRNMKSGTFVVGSRFYSVEQRESGSLTAVA